MIANTSVEIAHPIIVCQNGNLKAKNEISILNCGSLTPNGVEFLKSSQVLHIAEPAVPAK